MQVRRRKGLLEIGESAGSGKFGRGGRDTRKGEVAGACVGACAGSHFRWGWAGREIFEVGRPGRIVATFLGGRMPLLLV